jgi:hypothetical protein
MKQTSRFKKLVSIETLLSTLGAIASNRTYGGRLLLIRGLRARGHYLRTSGLESDEETAFALWRLQANGLPPEKLLYHIQRNLYRGVLLLRNLEKP